MAEQNKNKKPTPIYVPLSVINEKMTGEEYIDFNQMVITIITEMCTRGKVTAKTRTEIEIMEDSDPQKKYLQTLVDTIKDKITIPQVKANLVSFGKLILDHRIVVEQAYVDNKMLNWTELFKFLANENFIFDESSLSVLLLQESKRIRDMDKQKELSK